MSEPATREDLERMRDALTERIQIMDNSVNAMRSQNSAEHGSLFTKLSFISEIVVWIKAQWIRFSKP